MKKNIFLFNAHPSTERKLNVLKDTLKAFKHNQFDICLSTNFPVNDKEVYDLVDYLVYDKQDIKDYRDYGISYIRDGGHYFELEHCRMTIGYNSAYHYNVWRCIYNGLNLIKGLGYEYFVRVDGDCDGIVEDDINRLLYIKNEMLNQGKKMFYFGEVQSSVAHNANNHVPGEIWGGIPNFVIENMKLPYDINDWIKDGYLVLNSFERFVFESLRPVPWSEEPPIHNEEVYLADGNILLDLRKRQSVNKINKNSDMFMKTLFYFQEGNDTSVYLFVSNLYNMNVDMQILLDGELILSHFFYKNAWIWNEWDMDMIRNKSLKQIFKFEDGTVEFVETLLTDDKINKLRNKNNIVFK